MENKVLKIHKISTKTEGNICVSMFLLLYLYCGQISVKVGIENNSSDAYTPKKSAIFNTFA